MVKINPHFISMPGSYLFAEIAKRAQAYNGPQRLIRLGIGDVTQPLPASVIEALHKAADEQANAETFFGYGPYEGYSFLLKEIAEHEYASRGVTIELDEIFVSDGSKSDSANFQELFADDTVIALTDPVYPVYLDSNAMAGRAGNYSNGTWSKVVYLPCTAENNYNPELPKQKVDVIYLCSPNNPTGACMTKADLKKWVDYAKANSCIILYDAAYRQFITEPGIPRSIYEIEGAKDVAVEFCSFSKTAGFTGLRCSWTVVPKQLMVGDISLGAMWLRRQSTKFNGTAYIIQRAAAAIYTPEGKKQVQDIIDGYMRNAKVILDGLRKAGFNPSGGVNSPYIWFKTGSYDSWAFFDKLLNEAGVIGTPGSGFGPSGENHLRLTAFGKPDDTAEAIERIIKLF